MDILHPDFLYGENKRTNLMIDLSFKLKFLNRKSKK